MNMLHCPFCGMIPDPEEDEDCLYPSGTGWRDRPNGLREYLDFRMVPRSNWCYTLHCVQHHGGCGAEMHGDSRQEAIDKWNKRITT